MVSSKNKICGKHHSAFFEYAGSTPATSTNFKLNKMEITQEQFEAYVDVQMSGVTNMFDVRTVSSLSGLDRDQITTIMSNYGELEEKYNVNTNE